MKKILISLAIIGAVGAITLGITGAWWSDSATSSNASFNAGHVDLELSNTGYSPWSDSVSQTWDQNNMTPGGTPLVSSLWMKNVGTVDTDHMDFALANTMSGCDGTQSQCNKLDDYMRITRLDYAGHTLLVGRAGADLGSYVAPTSCDINVQGDYSTIRAAIAAAPAGDIICVQPGNYSTAWEGGGPLVIDKNLTLASTGGPSGTTIGVGVSITGDGAILKGFTIKPDFTFTGNGSPVHITASNVTVKDNVITGIRGNGSGTVKGIHVYKDGAPAISGIVITNNIIKDVHDTGKGSVGIMIQGNINGITVTHNTVKDISSVNTDHDWDYALGIEDTPTGGYQGSPLNVVITDNHIENITSVVEPGRGFSVDKYSDTNYAYAPQVTFERNDIVNVLNDITNKDPRSGAILNAQHNWFGDNGIAVNINGASKGEIGAVDYSNYAGGPFIGYINGQDPNNNLFADLDDFDALVITNVTPGLDANQKKELVMGVQLDGPTTPNNVMNGEVAMDMTITMQQGPGI